MRSSIFASDGDPRVDAMADGQAAAGPSLALLGNMPEQAAAGPLRTLRESLSAVDTRWQRRLFPHRRHILVDADTRMEYAVLAPILRALGHDERVAVWATSSTRPAGACRIFNE